MRLRLAVFEQDPARAAALYESVLKENPGEPAALVNLGGLYAAAGRTKEAAALWTRALEANPSIEEAVLNLSQVVPSPQGEDLLQRYLKLNPASAAARASLAGIAGKPR